MKTYDDEQAFLSFDFVSQNILLTKIFCEEVLISDDSCTYLNKPFAQ